jgi:hypothetical protein
VYRITQIGSLPMGTEKQSKCITLGRENLKKEKRHDVQRVWGESWQWLQSSLVVSCRWRDAEVTLFNVNGKPHVMSKKPSLSPNETARQNCRVSTAMVRPSKMGRSTSWTAFRWQFGAWMNTFVQTVRKPWGCYPFCCDKLLTSSKLSQPEWHMRIWSGRWRDVAETTNHRS